MTEKTMENGEHNGWKNYNTWNISAWINNDENLYLAAYEQVPFTAKTCEAFCRDIFPNGTPDMDGEAPDWVSIDWVSIAEGFNDKFGHFNLYCRVHIKRSLPVVRH